MSGADVVCLIGIVFAVSVVGVLWAVAVFGVNIRIKWNTEDGEKEYEKLRSDLLAYMVFQRGNRVLQVAQSKTNSIRHVDARVCEIQGYLYAIADVEKFLNSRQECAK